MVIMEWDEETGEMTFPEPALQDKDARQIVRMVWKRYHDFSDNELVTMMHRQGTPWSACYVPEQNRPIPDEITAMYYERLIQNVLRTHGEWKSV